MGRQSIRLRGHDYRQAGAYFLTLCTHHRECLFGEIEESRVILSLYGRVVEEEWHRSVEIRPELMLDSFVVMPNHVHGIVILPPSSEAGVVEELARKPRSLGAFVAGFKAAVTRRINQILASGCPIWQRNYYERIVRDEAELLRLRQYIGDNPARWSMDENYPRVR